MANVESRKNSLLLQTSTKVLIESLRTICAPPRESRTREQSQVRTWIINELERRHPEASEAVATAFEEADKEEQRTGTRVDVNYEETLIKAIVDTRSRRSR